MKHEDDEINRLLRNKPENFEDVKEWANFQLAIRSATKQESFLKEMAGLVTTIVAILGVVTSAFTAYQLWDKIAHDKTDQEEKYKFEALKLYTDHWEEFNKSDNCKKLLFFATAVKDKYPELNKTILDDSAGRGCVQTSSNSEETANFDENKPAQDKSSYNTIEQITPSVQSNVNPPTELSGFTFYIQYQIGNVSAKDTANLIRSSLSSKEIGATAPGTEAVPNVPKRDEIRMYKGSQTVQAKKLQQMLKEKTGRDFTIVSLEDSYPKLPANLMEIWLKE